MMVLLSELAAQLAQCGAQLRFLCLQLLHFPTAAAAAGPFVGFEQLRIRSCQCLAFGSA